MPYEPVAEPKVDYEAALVEFRSQVALKWDPPIGQSEILSLLDRTIADHTTLITTEGGADAD